jgi:hypothetical protein
VGNGPDLLGQLKRLLAATPAGTYAAPVITRKQLEEIVSEMAALRVALELSERGQGASVQRGITDKLLGEPRKGD